MKSNSSAISLALLGLAVVVYLGVINPMSASLFKTRTQLTDEESRLATIDMGNSQREDVKGRIAELTKTNEALRATLIAPLLNSYAMSVKSLVDTMATEAGLVNVEYNEGTLLALPVPKERIPENRTARRSVRIKAQADYAAAVSFLLRAEKELPLMTVQSFTVKTPQSASHNVQDVEIVLEWPGKGEVIR